MLAFAWRWHESAHDPHSRLSKRLGVSLCAGIGGQYAAADIGNLHFAYRPMRLSVAASHSWRPASLPNGKVAVFLGYFDNCTSIADELGEDPGDLARLYGIAVEQLGDEADRRIIGEYCAIISDPGNLRIRLSRSPLRAPPLHYYHSDQLAAAASVPRALFAAGVPQCLNQDRIADSALLNFSDREASWFEGIRRVPVGSVVELQRGHERTVSQYYDVLALPRVRMNSDEAYIARATELLEEGVRACLAGFQKPGIALSGGLDSPQVAFRALAALPAGQPLPTFTFHPEKGYDGRVQTGMSGDERPFVEAFAAMHPGLEPHFTANEGYEHDHRWTDFFHLMGGAPSGLCNMYVFHGLFSEAAKKGCDILLLGDWGNSTFSDKGQWGFVELLLTGRWREWWRSLTSLPDSEGSLLRRVVVKSLVPLLPDRLWRLLKRITYPKNHFLLDLLQPLSTEYRLSSGAEQRLRKSGLLVERYQPRNRMHARRLLFKSDDCEGAEIYQAFEQMYGVAQRDPTAYRPFVEFCLGLPTRMFMRDGQLRWLAKEMGRGIMPEEQRINRLNGRWDSDWHLRIGRRRKEFLAELDRLAGNERIAAMIDIPRLRAALEDWPEETEIDPQRYFARELAVPRGLLTARFVNYVEGRNET